MLSNGRPLIDSAAWQGQHPPRRRDVDNAARPAAHAGLRELRVVVRHDRVDDDDALVLFARLFDLLGRDHEGFAGRHQRGAVDQRPGVILDVRDLYAARTHLHRKLDHARNVVDVLAVDRAVDGERETVLLTQPATWIFLAMPPL